MLFLSDFSLCTSNLRWNYFIYIFSVIPLYFASFFSSGEAYFLGFYDLSCFMVFYLLHLHLFGVIYLQGFHNKLFHYVRFVSCLNLNLFYLLVFRDQIVSSVFVFHDLESHICYFFFFYFAFPELLLRFTDFRILPCNSIFMESSRLRRV